MSCLEFSHRFQRYEKLFIRRAVFIYHEEIGGYDIRNHHQTITMDFPCFLPVCGVPLMVKERRHSSTSRNVQDKHPCIVLRPIISLS